MSTMDCAPEDACIELRCRPSKSSAAGEILAATGAAHTRLGHHAEAAREYAAAVDAYRKHGAAVPADTLCALASASLRGAKTNEARELAAKQADECLRASHFGMPERSTTVHLLSELRVEGLDPAHFDEQQPATVFLTARPERPKADSIEIEIDLPERDTPGFSELTSALHTPTARDMVSRCFLEDWEARRQNRAEATLRLKLTTRMKDMGDYDAFEPTLEVTRDPDAGAAVNATPFTDCVLRGVQTALGPGPKLNRVVAWEERLHVVAHL